jgi:hypothetical protein
MPTNKVAAALNRISLSELRNARRRAERQKKRKPAAPVSASTTPLFEDWLEQHDAFSA